MDIITVVNTLFFANTYIVVSGNKAIIIDPGSSTDEQIKVIESRGLELVAILATHGHIDHIIGVYDIHRKYGAPFYIHRKDEDLLSMDEVERIRPFIGDTQISIKEPDKYLEEGSLSLPGFTLDIIHTPGHTMGSVCIKIGGNIFTGDTIFRESVGRTDFGGDINLLVSSIHRKLFLEARDAKLYPGHGPVTTVGHEVLNNPFVGVNGIYPFRDAGY